MISYDVSIDEFWELSWYEVGLYQTRFREKAEKEKFALETSWDQTRILWAAIVNAGFSRPKASVKPEQLIKLSRDKSEKQEKKPLSQKEMKQMFGTKFKKDG